MKRYLATEVRHVAQTITVKKNKEFFDNALNEVMYLIEEAARNGEYEVKYELDSNDDNIKKTFTSLMVGYGYYIDNDGFIRW